MQTSCGFACRAAQAIAAPHHQACHDVITNSDVAHVGPDRFDDAGTLVAEDHGTRALECAVEVVVVAVAQPGGNRAHQDLAADGMVVLDLGDIELVGTVTKHRGAHDGERRRDYLAARRWRGRVYAPAANAFVSWRPALSISRTWWLW